LPAHRGDGVEPLVGTVPLRHLPLRGVAPGDQAPQLGVDLALGGVEEEMGDGLVDELAEVVPGLLAEGEETEKSVAGGGKLDGRGAGGELTGLTLRHEPPTPVRSASPRRFTPGASLGAPVRSASPRRFTPGASLGAPVRSASPRRFTPPTLNSPGLAGP